MVTDQGTLTLTRRLAARLQVSQPYLELAHALEIHNIPALARQLRLTHVLS